MNKSLKVLLLLSFLFVALVLFIGGCSKFAGIEALRNGTFSLWSKGDVKDPDDWILGGDGRGNVTKDSATVKGSATSAKIVHVSGEPIALYQDVMDFVRFKDKAFEFTCWVNSSKPDAVFLVLDDGKGWKQSRSNTSAGSWESLTLNGKIAADLSKLRAHIYVKDSAVAFISGASLKTEK